MSVADHVEFVLRIIDEAGQEWQQKFQTLTEKLLQEIEQVLDVSKEYLIELSKSTANDEQSRQDRLNAQRIVFKLKQLRTFMGNLWPTRINSFTRDVFDVGSYHIKTLEFFHPVQFYPGTPSFVMKLYQWSVYDTNGTIVFRYFLEKSQMIGEPPYYVLGKTFLHGRSQLQSYESTIPDYNRMKIDVIANLTGQGPQRLTTMIVPSYKP